MPTVRERESKAAGTTIRLDEESTEALRKAREDARLYFPNFYEGWRYL